MSHDLAILTITAASLGLVHTLLGPDHYLPFVVLPFAHGARHLPLRGLDRYSHALAGFAIFACGVAIHLGM